MSGLSNSSMRHPEILLPRPCAVDEEQIDNGAKYILVRSTSPALASASNKLGTWVSMKIDEGWTPHGSPQVHYDGEKFHLIQALTKT